MIELLRSLAGNRRLLKDFVLRDLKARYVGSSMGFFWSVVFPIINLFVYMFVFRLVLNARWSDSQGPSEVALVMLAGIVVWSAFAETVSRSTNSLVENSNLIQKVVFPSEVLPLYLTISSLINMCIGLPVVLLCVGWFVVFAPPEVAFEGVAEGAVVAEQHVGEWIGAEGEAVPTVALLKLSRGYHRELRVPFTVAGSARPGEDFLVSASPLVIPAGHVYAAIEVTPLTDELSEGPETVELTLADPTPGSLGDVSTHVVTLIDGSQRPTPRAGRDPEAGYLPLMLGPSLLALPLLFLLQTVFTAGLGYFLATLNLFLRDTYHLVGVFVTVWMFGTPIFYPGQMVEKAGFGWLLEINPMHWLIDAYRSILCFGAWPDWTLVARFALAGVVVLFLGSSFFMSQKRRFPDLL